MDSDRESLKMPLILPAITVSLLAFTLRATCPIEWETRGTSGDPIEIVLLNPWARSLLNWAPLVALAILALIAWTLFRKKRIGHGLIVVGLGLFGFVGSWAIFVVSNLAQWVICDTVQGPSGEVFSFLDSSFLQGQRMAMTVQTNRNWLATWERVIGVNNGDNPRSWASVIRPSDSVSGQYGRLYICDSEWLLGIRSKDCCFLAYHLPTRRFYGHGDIETLSPFLLLQSDTQPHDPDVERLLQRLKQSPTPGPGVPAKGVIRKGLAHANPKVRDIAARFLEVLPQAAGRVAASQPQQND